MSDYSEKRRKIQQQINRMMIDLRIINNREKELGNPYFEMEAYSNEGSSSNYYITTPNHRICFDVYSTEVNIKLIKKYDKEWIVKQLEPQQLSPRTIFDTVMYLERKLES